MVGVGDRNRERVGGVGAGDLDTGQQSADHRVDLGLFGIAVADHGFLDQPRGIFADFEPAARCAQQGDSARLAELEGRLRVLVDEDFLNRRGPGRAVGDERVELAGQVRQPLRQCFAAVGLELPVGDMAEPIALGTDQAPAGGSEPRVEAEDQSQPVLQLAGGIINPASPAPRRGRRNCPRRSGRRHLPRGRRSASSASPRRRR